MVQDQNTPADPRWQAVIRRDRASDGLFVYAVRTTGVYCRPSCPSRQAKPQNVAFFATPSDAEAAGLEVEQRFSSYDLLPFAADTNYVVTILRRQGERQQAARPGAES